MKGMRTQQEIKSKIESIKKERAAIREFSIFGKNNWEEMDTQVAILEKCLAEKWNWTEAEDKLDERFENMEAEDVSEDEQCEDGERYIYEWLLKITS